MPLPEGTLAEIEAGLAEAAGGISSLEDIISDMQKSGLNTTREDLRLEQLRTQYRQMKLFLGFQRQRTQGVDKGS